tara:strand:+ start:439 stop:1221 length:783 start_codon:yes stop_codon:yes gene_type:complete
MNQEQLKLELDKCLKKILDAKLNGQFYIDPFKHIIVDNFFSQNIAEEALKSFEILDKKKWDSVNDVDIEIKMRSNWASEFDIPEKVLPCIRILNSAPFLNVMNELFNIKGLLMDPYFKGGGLNITPKNGLLDIHVDGNFHDKTGAHRRLNAIVYLNKNWEKSWKGELGLYDKKGIKLIKSIEPIFNRLIIFQTNDYSFHGLPEPINFPENENRKSIILYYYSLSSRGKDEVNVKAPHSALWVKKKYNDKNGYKTRKIYDD